MTITETNSLSNREKREIFLLWNSEYPRSLAYERIEELQHYLDRLKDHSHKLLKDDNGQVKGWYIDFIRENKRWFATILHSGIQGQGFGSQLLNLAKQKREELHGWVIVEECLKFNGDPYMSPVEFYKKNKFNVRKEVKLITEKISAIKIEWYKEPAVRK